MPKNLAVNSITGLKGRWVRELFFLLGLVGALGLRVVLILSNFNPPYAKFSWYIAMISLTFYYFYRRWIEARRRKIIIEGRLIEKINSNRLTKNDRKEISLILGSTIVSRQKLNLDILFLASIVGLVVQFIIDFS